MLESLHNTLRVVGSLPAAAPGEIAELSKHFDFVPSEYLELVTEATEIELLHEDGQYIRIWGPAGCVEMNDAYGIVQRIGGAIPIGDDGGGHVIFYFVGQHGFGLYHVGFGNLDSKDAIWIAPSLGEFVTTAMNISSF